MVHPTPPHRVLESTHHSLWNLLCESMLSPSPFWRYTGGTYPCQISLSSDDLRNQSICKCQSLFLAGQGSQHSGIDGFAFVSRGGLTLEAASARNQTHLCRGRFTEEIKGKTWPLNMLLHWTTHGSC